jgi:DNA-binding winged helix-turn-helix (wHTH) protein/TolB-like protein/tetratricopeptide (TPR) repeat protein
MQSAKQSKITFQFGLFVLDVASRELRRQGVLIRLQDLPLRLLLTLLDRAGEVVSREDLRQKLWPADTYVDFEGSVNAALTRVRAALGDSADNPIFIATIPKRGYRFIAPVTSECSSEAAQEPVPALLPVSTAAPSQTTQSRWGWQRPWWVVSFVVILSIFVVVPYFWRSRTSVAASPKVLAVLPFANEGAGSAFDYLRYAIANDLVTDLTHARSVSVRPFASTNKYGTQAIDPAAAGAQLRVSHVLTGGFLVDRDGLRVTLELVDVERNLSIWRDEVSVPLHDLIALHDRLAERTTVGLLPAINVVGASTADVPAPRNEEALDLFLHSLTLPLGPEMNQMAIKKLEEAVSADPDYAPAWEQLAWRYYMDFHYGNGGQSAITKSLRASKRQSELDPNTLPVSITIHVEQGNLNDAYDQAAQFLRRRPDSSMAHFWMSYVLRYAGVLDEANKQCDAALTLDPGFNMLRSCAFPSIMAGDYVLAQRYIALDENFGAWMRLRIALRTGDKAAVLKESSKADRSGFSRADRLVTLFQTCSNHAAEGQLRRAIADVEDDPVAALDHELYYQIAEDLAFCGQSDAALQQLRRSIQGNYCSYPAMDKDPVFDSIRQRPEFAELRSMAIHCQQEFINHRIGFDAQSSATQ